MNDTYKSGRSLPAHPPRLHLTLGQDKTGSQASRQAGRLREGGRVVGPAAGAKF